MHEPDFGSCVFTLVCLCSARDSVFDFCDLCLGVLVVSFRVSLC